MIREKSNRQNETREEEAIILKSKSDPEAFRPLYEKYFNRIFLFVLHRVGDKPLAADLTSQAFLKALVNLKKFTRSQISPGRAKKKPAPKEIPSAEKTEQKPATLKFDMVAIQPESDIKAHLHQKQVQWR